MKETNKIKLAIIATTLKSIGNGGRSYNGNNDAFIGSIKGLHSLGDQILDIVDNELKPTQ